MQALAWKLLQDLESKSLGTAEVEKDSVKRSWQRMVKKGLQMSLKDFGNSEEYRRDKEYVKGLMSLRVKQTKSDWEKARETYRQKKEELRVKMTSCGKLNQYKKRMKEIHESYVRQYKQGREKT